MADYAVLNLTWDDNDGTDCAAGTGTVIDHTGTAVITPTGPLEDMVIIVRNTEGSTNVVTIEEGDSPPALSSGLSHKHMTTIAATTGAILLPPLESARFLQSNGTVRLTFEANTTGFILAFQKPIVRCGA
jgi:hypothetical protein